MKQFMDEDFILSTDTAKKLFHDYAEKKGVHIYNATRGGHLEIFPRVTLEDVLNLDKE